MSFDKTGEPVKATNVFELGQEVDTKDKGVPSTLKTWAAGVDTSQVGQDPELKKKIKQWQEEKA